MATSKKVNELPQETPTLNDTLLGSNATKEYACKVEDLSALVGGGFAIRKAEDETTGDMTLNKTWQEICDAVTAGQLAFVYYIDDSDGVIYNADPVVGVVGADGEYSISTANDLSFVAASATDYPVADL